jgi:hypothetical protein
MPSVYALGRLIGDAVGSNVAIIIVIGGVEGDALSRLTPPDERASRDLGTIHRLKARPRTSWCRSHQDQPPDNSQGRCGRLDNAVAKLHHEALTGWALLAEVTIGIHRADAVSGSEPGLLGSHVGDGFVQPGHLRRRHTGRRAGAHRGAQKVGPDGNP